MPQDDNTTKIILVVMGLPYVIVTLCLLLVCCRSIMDKFSNWSDVYGDYDYNYKWPDMERFQEVKKERKPRRDKGKVVHTDDFDAGILLKKLRSRPVRALYPIQPEEQDNQDQVFSRRIVGPSVDSPLYFFESPGICQQTRFDSREINDDSGRGIYGKRRELSALDYLEIYN